MRAIQTFILRLLVDPAEPEVLHGALQPMPEGETHPFGGEQALLTLLRRLVVRAEEISHREASEGEAARRETQNVKGEMGT